MVSMHHTRPLPCEAQNRLWVDGNKGSCPNWGCCGPSLFIALALRSCHIWGNETTRHWLISILYEYAWLGPSSLGGMSLHCLAFRTNSNIFHAQLRLMRPGHHPFSVPDYMLPSAAPSMDTLFKKRRKRERSFFNMYKFCDPF